MSRAGLTLGYLLPTRENVMGGEHGVGTLMDAARHAQNEGFDSVWVGDSLFARPRHDPLTLLAALAPQVPNLQLGTAVLLPALRNPVVLAQQLATIDQISEGRLVVGAGIAANAPPIHAEFKAAGVPFEKRVGRFNEGFALCRKLWSGEPVSWNGRWYLEEATLAPVPFQKGGPPIWVASSVDPGIKRVARLFDGWFPIGPDAATIAKQHRLLTDTAKVHDRAKPTTAVYLTICIRDGGEDPDQMIDRYLEDYYGMPAKLLRTIQACCGGELEQVLAFLRDFSEAGAEHLVLRIVGDHRKTLSTLAKHRRALTA